jgi:hypothetical protein
MEAVLAWLREGDPAIRWQVLADLLDAPAGEVAAERARVATEGWGAALLARQDPDGTWAGGLYSPKWTSTTYTLLLLRQLGLAPDHPAARTGCERLLRGAYRYGGGLNAARTTRVPETCITGMYVALAAYFTLDDPVAAEAVEWLLTDAVLPDGGWNCAAIGGRSVHSSFHTTINVLEALAEVRRHRADAALDGALAAGRGFLFAHRMFRSHRTGEPVDPAYCRFSFPPRWRYDVLRGLDHLREVDAPADPAVAEAIEVVRRKRRADGRWPLQNRHPGRVWFELERVGQPSRWNTLRALRVLHWWDRACSVGSES